MVFQLLFSNSCKIEVINATDGGLLDVFPRVSYQRLFESGSKPQTQRPGYWGNYPSWESALSDSDGYDSPVILEKVKTAILQVSSGRGAYERDSVVFEQVQIEWIQSLLQHIKTITAFKKRPLRVIDFGGSLGGTFRALKSFLDPNLLPEWIVVEQDNYVECGNEHFKDRCLCFFDAVESVPDTVNVDIILFSGVLQYLPYPFKILEQAVALGIEYILIDRTPFIRESDRITVQVVPREIYPASYPAWFFNSRNFLTFFQERNYMLKDMFQALDQANIPSQYLGILFQSEKNNLGQEAGIHADSTRCI